MITGVYTERGAAIPGAVVWRTLATDPSAVKRVLPDGCMDLLWMDGALRIAGPDTAAYLPVQVPGARGLGLRLAPGFGPEVFGLPANELRDQRVDLDAVWPTRVVRSLTDRVAAADDPGAVLEAIAAGSLADGDGPEPWALSMAAAMRRGESVSDTARAVGFSERQLHRRSIAAFGYGPKTLARILRLQRALEHVHAGQSLALAAARAGYADQAHLSRDARRLAGATVSDVVHDSSAENRLIPLPSGSWTTAKRWPHTASKGFRWPS